MGVVLQENFLFNKSVSENIAQSKPEASLEEIIEAAKLSGAHEFILKLPMGYDTILAEGGQSLWRPKTATRDCTNTAVGSKSIDFG